MRLHIVAVGRARDGAIAELYRDYVRRLGWPVALHEVELRALPAPGERAGREAALLRARVPAGATIVALDPRGEALSSEAFARRIGRWRDEATADLAFVIGGADGLTDEIRRAAALVLSLGSMTWPHLLARVMLAEQLFRAQSILSGHPYHRG
ncbi:MAG: 23S rRNA (pseudouridine(1915)-N(3))-methyltransferase RlmH [Alphaproteobacteria bacterium]